MPVPAPMPVPILLGLINANLRECAGRLTLHVDRTLQGITMKLGDPFTDAKLRSRLQTAAQAPLAMVHARRDAIVNASQLSRTKNAEAEAAREEAKAEAEARRKAEEELSRMRGSEPESAIVTPPQPSATARSTRRSGRKSRR